LLKSLMHGSAGGPAQASAPNAASAGAAGLRYERGGRIIAIVSASYGDSLKEGTLQVLAPLRPHATDVVMVDVRDPDFDQQLAAAASGPVWFAMSSFGVGEVHDAGGGKAASRWREAGVPFLRLYGDLPAYLPSRHLQRFRNSVNVYGHAEHQAFFRRWFDATAETVWLPYYPVDAMPFEAVNKDAKLAGAVVFPKNGNCPERLRRYWREALPPSVAKALEAVGETLLARLDEDVDIAAAVQHHYSRLSIDLAEDRGLLFFLVAQLDDFLRRVKSTMIATSLLDLPVVIRGETWDHVDFSGRRARHDPDQDYGRTRSVLDNALAMLDMSPNTQSTPHDRVLRAAGRYTAFLSNRTQFYTNSFRNAGAFTFRFEPDSIRACVETAIAHPRETVEMGFAQAERMRELLTPERYVEQIAAVVDACALACASRRPEGTQPYVELTVRR
jgi:hypothetical protein